MEKGKVINNFFIIVTNGVDASSEGITRLSKEVVRKVTKIMDEIAQEKAATTGSPPPASSDGYPQDHPISPVGATPNDQSAANTFPSVPVPVVLPASPLNDENSAPSSGLLCPSLFNSALSDGITEDELFGDHPVKSEAFEDPEESVGENKHQLLFNSYLRQLQQCDPDNLAEAPNAASVPLRDAKMPLRDASNAVNEDKKHCFIENYAEADLAAWESVCDFAVGDAKQRKRRRGKSDKELLKTVKVVRGSTQMYACKVCFARFARNSDCARHARKHNPTKFYHCDTCQRGFSRRDSLYRHVRIHAEGSTIKSTSPKRIKLQ